MAVNKKPPLPSENKTITYLALSTLGSGSCRVCRGRRQGAQASRGAREVGAASRGAREVGTASLAAVGRALASREAMVPVCKTGLASKQCTGGQGGWG